MSIRILLVDDHKFTRECIRSLLDKEADTEVIAEAKDGRKAVRLAWKLSPDIVTMDIAMPVLNGIEATRQIVTNVSGVKVIGLSTYSDRQIVEEMLKAGASGYLLKNYAFEELADAIQTVFADRTYLGSAIADIAVEG